MDEILKQLVLEEATKLRKNATKEEIEKLDFKYFDPDDKTQCIYGMMTGHCSTNRAVELIRASCSRVYDKHSSVGLDEPLSKTLNGSPLDKHRNYWWSPIEVYISYEDKEANYRLIQFLKGERETL